MRLRGSVVLLTGATGGMGQCILGSLISAGGGRSRRSGFGAGGGSSWIFSCSGPSGHTKQNRPGASCTNHERASRV